MLGFDVSPVIDSSRMYRSSVPLAINPRVILSSQSSDPFVQLFCAFMLRTDGSAGRRPRPDLNSG